MPSLPPSSSDVPLVVDLDGTLIKTDLLVETANLFIIHQPQKAWRLIPWLMSGRQVLKEELAQAAEIDAAALPYHLGVLAWLREQRAQGRSLVLATASHHLMAQKVADHLGLFDAVLASDHHTNLKSEAKRDLLVARYGKAGFDYVGNDRADLPVWEAARQAHVVSRSSALIKSARDVGHLGKVFTPERPGGLPALLKAMRLHQWLKNLLILVPLLAGHQYGNPTHLLQAALAFLVFGLTASSVYLINDLVDVADDRHHRRKRHRPFASGDLSLMHGWLVAPVLLASSFALSAITLPLAFVACQALYFVLTLAYSLKLKQYALVDVLVLAALYTLRIIAGTAALALQLSFWLLSFSMFIFFSLAFVKRYSELLDAKQDGQQGPLRGRGYGPEDLEIVSSFGIGAGYIAVLVLALYVQDGRTAQLYQSPTVIWLACPLLLLWVSRTWLLAHRGQMHDDPIVYALTDKVSWGIGLCLLAIFMLARLLP